MGDILKEIRAGIRRDKDAIASGRFSKKQVRQLESRIWRRQHEINNIKAARYGLSYTKKRSP